LKPGAAVWDRAHRALTIGLLLTISVTAFEAMAVATIMPAVAAGLGAGDVASSLGWYGWVFSGFMLANLVAIPASGSMSDRGDPLMPFVIGSVLFVAGLLVAGVAPSMPCLVAARIAQGFGAGALSSIAYVGIARGYEPADQPRMLALFASAWVIPGLLGPGAAALLASVAGWRSVFLLLVPVTLASSYVAARGLRSLSARDAAEQGGATSTRDAVQLAAGAALALLATNSGSAAFVAAGVAVGAAVAVPALRRLFPQGTLVAARGAPAALAAKTLVTFAFFGCEAFVPLSLTMVRGEPIHIAGLALTVGTLSWTTGTWIQERLVGKVELAVLAATGLALTALAICGASWVLVASSPAAVAVASWMTAGLGIGIAYPATTLVVFERTRGQEGQDGSAAASLQLANVLGIALGTGTAGAVLAIAAAGGVSTSVAIATSDALMLTGALAGLVAALRSGPQAVAAPVAAGAL
jgi:MFS family permease